MWNENNMVFIDFYFFCFCFSLLQEIDEKKTRVAKVAIIFFVVVPASWPL